MNINSNKAIENALEILSFPDGNQPYSFTNRLIEEKELSDLVINCLPGIFYLQDHTGKYLRWNHNFEKASGYGRKEIEKKHPLYFFALTILAWQTFRFYFRFPRSGTFNRPPPGRFGQ